MASTHEEILRDSAQLRSRSEELVRTARHLRHVSWRTWSRCAVGRAQPADEPVDAAQKNAGPQGHSHET
jgi:hypothetical protein